MSRYSRFSRSQLIAKLIRLENEQETVRSIDSEAMFDSEQFKITIQIDDQPRYWCGVGDVGVLAELLAPFREQGYIREHSRKDGLKIPMVLRCALLWLRKGFPVNLLAKMLPFSRAYLGRKLRW